MHIQDCLEEILHLEDTDLAASLADASRLFSCKKRQLVAKPDACSDWIPFLVSGVIRGYLTDEYHGLLPLPAWRGRAESQHLDSFLPDQL